MEELNPDDGSMIYGDVESITVTFDKNVRWVDEGSADNRVLVFNQAANILVIVDEITIDDNQLVVEFDGPLPEGTYTYSVNNEAGIIEDLAGNEFNGSGVNDWEFEVRQGSKRVYHTKAGLNTPG